MEMTGPTTILTKCLGCRRWMFVSYDSEFQQSLCRDCMYAPRGRLAPADTPMPDGQRILPKKKRPIKVKERNQYVQ